MFLAAEPPEASGEAARNAVPFPILNYDMELKIQERVHSGKLRITVERQVNLKWQDKFKVFVNEVCKFSLLCLVGGW